MGGRRNLGLDDNNAHVQPNGAYHYHGLPTGILQRLPWRQKPVLLGWAADGFPIYGPYGHRDGMDLDSPMVALRSGYRLKPGKRSGGPGGPHDGSYTADWEYVQGSGDLDSCNGREGITPEFPQGTYHYVLTDTFPFIPRCWKGSPDPSFFKGPGNRGGGRDRQRKQKGPPPEAIRACEGASQGSACSFRARHGEWPGQCGTPRAGVTACMPEGHRRGGPPIRRR